jgi:hypothetical protein
MNTDALAKAYRENDAVRAICDHLSNRTYNQTETKLHRITRHLEDEAYEFKRAEIIAAFRALEESEVGKYVEGRHGWPSRFVWSAKSLSLTALATGAAPEDTTPAEVAEETGGEFLEHSFVLRPDLSVALELPSDLTQSEAKRLALFISALPFNGEA